jgi:hypothetical protein
MHGVITHLPIVKSPNLTLVVIDAEFPHVKYKLFPVFDYAPRHKHVSRNVGIVPSIISHGSRGR